VAIQFREFGTRLDYVAKVKGNGRIWLEVRPYVSEIDPSRAVSINGISVPGLRSRYLETGVELGAGQTLALGRSAAS
jgi:pilus assembly protein CpaC